MVGGRLKGHVVVAAGGGSAHQGVGGCGSNQSLLICVSLMNHSGSAHLLLGRISASCPPSALQLVGWLVA